MSLPDQWTLELLASVPDQELPLRVGRQRRRKSESISQWRARLLKLVEDGIVDLTPKVVGGKDAFAARTPEALLSLASLGVNTEEAQRVFSEPAITPLMASYVNATEQMQREVSEDDRDGLFDVRRMLFEWMGATWDLKYEEAHYCGLQCLTCPSGQVLGCATDNLSSAASDGFDLRGPLFEVGKEDT